MITRLKIDLLWLNPRMELPSWNLGSLHICKPEVGAIINLLNESLPTSIADAWLFWDPNLGMPDEVFNVSLLNQTPDVWHAGLRFGLGGKPEMIDYVSPTWMFNCDPDTAIEATSWRLSLKACLIRTQILQQLGGPRPEFETLDGAGLEMGYRYIRKGVFVRYVPELVPKMTIVPKFDMPIGEQLRFIRDGFGKTWLTWACLRSFLNNRSFFYIGMWKKLIREDNYIQPRPYHRRIVSEVPSLTESRVSVLIPTVNRYPYLRTLLGQLRSQTVSPIEILIIDQTPQFARDNQLVQDFSDLPISMFFLNKAGQCTSRNLGLQQAKGDFILFIDDDDEIPPNLIEKHLLTLQALEVNISNGVACEVGAGELSEDFKFMRLSNVFPTNNTLIKREILKKSGSFDIAYDQGQRADHDLGMRLYLSGEMLVLNPEITVLHHHAPTGGLREHKARINTYAASRQQLFKHNLPTVSDIYLAKRYFSDRQVREMLWISVLGTFSLKGPLW